MIVVSTVLSSTITDIHEVISSSARSFTVSFGSSKNSFFEPSANRISIVILLKRRM